MKKALFEIGDNVVLNESEKNVEFEINSVFKDENDEYYYCGGIYTWFKEDRLISRKFKDGEA